MTYLCIIFIAPAYFMSRSKWGPFALNAVLYGLACLCILSIIGIFIAPIFWALSVGHAAFHLRREMMMQHAEMIATKMAEKMSETQQPPKIQSR